MFALQISHEGELFIIQRAFCKNNVLYLENEQGIKEYRYWNLEQEGLLKYEFRITCPFTQDITSKWVEQSYVYSMTLMSGELPASGEPPFANIDTVQPLLTPTKLSVLSSINGGF